MKNNDEEITREKSQIEHSLLKSVRTGQRGNAEYAKHNTGSIANQRFCIVVVYKQMCQLNCLDALRMNE